MSSIDSARAILATLQLLQGPFATGQATVRSTGATGIVPAGSFAIPIVSGQLFEEGIVVVTKNPATQDGSWPVTAAGAAVGIAAVRGGEGGNLAAATELRWDASLAGVELVSVVAGGGLTGGSWLTPAGSLRQLRQYKDLGSREQAQAFFNAQVGETPAAVLAWAGAIPAAGTTEAHLGADPSRVGRKKRLFKNQWELYLVTTRWHGDQERQREGDLLRDAVLDMLSDRVAYRDLFLSSPQGIEIVSAGVHSVTPSAYVDLIRFTNTFTLQMRDERTFTDWLKTRIRLEREQLGLNPEKLNVPDFTVNMP